MPSSPNYVRDLKQENKYQATPKQKAKRAARGRARYALIKKGKVRIGDGLDVAHADDNPLNNSSKNLKVQSPSVNRSYARTNSASMKNKGKGLGHE